MICNFKKWVSNFKNIWRKEFFFYVHSFKNADFLHYLFFNFQSFFCQKTIMTSHHKIITRGRQSDKLSFKGSLVAERKLELELGILILTLLPLENAFVDFTHIIRYIPSLYSIIAILTVVLHNYTKYHWNKTNLLKMFCIRIAVKKTIKSFIYRILPATLFRNFVNGSTKLILL